MLQIARAEVARNPAMRPLWAHILDADEKESGKRPQKPTIQQHQSVQKNSQDFRDQWGFASEVPRDQWGFTTEVPRKPQASAALRRAKETKRTEPAQVTNDEPLPSFADLLADLDADATKDRQESRPSGVAGSAAVPPLDDLLASLDGEETEVPSLEEMLASLERDAKDEAELENAEDSRQDFFDLGKSTEIALHGSQRPPTTEELEVRAEVMARIGKFSYNSVEAIGNAILAESRRFDEEVDDAPPKGSSSMASASTATTSTVTQAYTSDSTRVTSEDLSSVFDRTMEWQAAQRGHGKGGKGRSKGRRVGRGR